MTLRRLAWRGARFHWRQHVAAALGIVVSSAVMVGALVVGDSVPASLRAIALARLGRAEVAVTTGEHRLRHQVAEALGASLDADVAPVLRMAATAASGDGRPSVSRVQVLGVDERFWRLDPHPGTRQLPADAILANRRLATLLALREGDEIVLRLPEQHAISGELPVTWRVSPSRPARLRIDAVVDDAHLGRFSLEASQRAPATLFMPRGTLGVLSGAGDRANVMLLASHGGRPPGAPAILAALRSHLGLEDLGHRLQPTSAGGCQLVSRSFFLAPAVANAAREAFPRSRRVLTYFANSIERAGSVTPYSFVAAAEPPWVPRTLRDDEIVLTQWLARDLEATLGEEVDLRFFAPAIGTRLAEATARFRVGAIVPTETTDRRLVPDLPGITGAETCRSWDPTFPLDLGRVRPIDEAYWDEHGPAPKALVTLAAGQRLWGNRHGDLTAVRLPSGANARCEVARAIMDRVDPSSIGIRVAAVRDEALRAANGSVDFGGLFLGLSTFLMAAALLFVALFQSLAVSRRADEWRNLVRLGLAPGQVRRLVLLEGAPVALLASVAGAALAGPYAAVLMRLAPAVWGGASVTSSLVVSVRWGTLALGAAVNSALAIVVMAIASRRALSCLRDRQSTGMPLARRAGRHAILAKAVLTGTGMVVAVAMASLLGSRHGASPLVAWSSGLVALGAGLCGASALLDVVAERRLVSLPALGLRSVARQRRRSLALVTGLAIAVFLVSVVAAHRAGALPDTSSRSSGTGGFALMAETTLPVRHDLDSREGRRALGLPLDLPARFVSLRVRDGDDASCRNLNRVTVPRLLGVDPSALAARGAFSFAAIDPAVAGAGGWRVLERDLGDGVVPAVADASTITWGLGKKVGDVIELTDDGGRPLRLRLVGSLEGSILQGNLILSDRQLTRLFPSTVGFGALLIDAAPGDDVPAVAAALRGALRDHGLDLRPAAERLAELRRVEDAYLAIFLALGALGLSLATAGLAAVVARDLIARRGELAFLRATGFSSATLARMLLCEHALLVILGVAVGVIAGGVAFAHMPSATALVTTVVAVLPIPAIGVVATMLACRPMLKDELVGDLRYE